MGRQNVTTESINYGEIRKTIARGLTDWPRRVYEFLLRNCAGSWREATAADAAAAAAAVASRHTVCISRDYQ